MDIKNNNSLSFKGFGIEGTVPVKRVSSFLNNKNNLKLINALEARNVDVFMTSGGKKLRFERKPYGDLEKYGVPAQLVEGFDKISSNISEFIEKIHIALKAGEDDFATRIRKADNHI